MARVLLITILLFLTSKSWANSCCGQSPASFTVLSLAQKLSLTTSYSFTKSQGRVFNSDDFYVWKDRQRRVQALQLNVASSLSDRHQVFLSTAIMQGEFSNSLSSASSQNLSDTQIGYTFEALPEYSFSYWKPSVYISALANLPTGQSIYDEVSLSEGADVTGHNQWGLGLGLTLKKVYFPLTITVQAKSLRVFSKQFNAVEVSGFYDNSLALLFNYALSYGQLALNFGVTSNHLSSRSLSTTDVRSGIIQNSSLSLGLQKVFGDAWSAGINYSDQTLLGKARNSLLNRSFVFNINYNYF